ncbi:tetratricopeptide repeat protein [Candidatus Micrarchaeota archaeon]|nr:tetratricopeptide repeat protein [Candidatus Micrarchaeota archaeon]
MEETLALLRAGKKEQVRKRAKDTIRKTRWDPESWFRMGMVSQHEGRLEYATECFERALQIKPDAKYYRAKASVHMELFEFEEAMDDLHHALEISEDTDSLFLVAACLLFLDSPESAKYMKMAKKRDPARTNELLREFFLRFFKEDKSLSEKAKRELWKKISP